ncbi:protein ABHD11, partial [Trichonephila inaurata madagascariensis]
CTPVPLIFTVVNPEGWDESKAPIIFLHGVTASKEYWFDIPKTVADMTKRKAYVVDSRNHGDSPWTNELNSDLNVADLLNFMDYINVPKAIIVGHSMGGATAFALAFKEPQRIEKLVIEDVSIGAFPEHVIAGLRHKVLMSSKALEVLPTHLNIMQARDFIANYVFESLPPEAKRVVHYDINTFVLKEINKGRYAFKTNMKALTQALEDPKNLSVEPTGVYEGPVCIIYGEKSPFKM